jgi:D-alanyl-D-alanine carboxypeptidase
MGGYGIMHFRPQPNHQRIDETGEPVSISAPVSSRESTLTLLPSESAIESVPDLPTADSNATRTQTLLGHFPYEEAPPEDLQPISSDGRILMRQAAARAFLDMKEAARSQGVYLVPISGFRSEEDQKYLFFEVKAQRGQVAMERSEVSEPPGYSEHHTGYAVNIGDANLPAMDLSPNFENTPAFQWMKENAAYYSFELSFPKGNTQGVSYKPWHWRFVGDRHSLETFYKARTQEVEATQP